MARRRAPRRAARRRHPIWRSGFRCRPGSAAAAATRRRRSRRSAALWRVRRSARRCARSPASLGADVPYFLEGGTVLGLERGDLLFPLARSSAGVGVAGAALVRREHDGRVSAGGTRPRAGASARPPQDRVAPYELATISRLRSSAHHPEIGAASFAALDAGGRQSTPRCRAAARRCSACLRRRSGAASGPRGRGRTGVAADRWSPGP